VVVISWSRIFSWQVAPVTVFSAPVGVHFILRLRFKVVFFWLINSGAGSLKLSILKMLRASSVHVLLGALSKRILLGAFAARKLFNVLEVLSRTNTCFT